MRLPHLPILLSTALALAAVTLAGSAGCASGGNARAEAPAADPALARAENERAIGLMQASDYPAAEAALRKSLDADLTYGQARNNLGIVYLHTDSLYKAAWEFENAVRLMPYRPEPRNNLGLVFERAGQLTKAADAYTAARELAPDNPEYLANLARARVRRGDRDADTRQLLEELALKDSRPQWTDWARRHLIRLNAASPSVPQTQPAARPPGPWITP